MSSFSGNSFPWSISTFWLDGPQGNKKVPVHRRRKQHIPLWPLPVLSTGLVMAAWLSPTIPPASHFVPQPNTASIPEPTTSQESVREVGRGRAVYRYSVIAGGAFSVAEVTHALYQDPVARDHYASFDMDHVRVIEAPAARLAYVSYRMGDDIYWTRKKMLLAKGEALITDGEHVARARCGNRVEDKPQRPFRAIEPTAAELDESEIPEPTIKLRTTPVVDLFPSFLDSSIAAPLPLDPSALGTAPQGVSAPPSIYVVPAPVPGLPPFGFDSGGVLPYLPFPAPSVNTPQLAVSWTPFQPAPIPAGVDNPILAAHSGSPGHGAALPGAQNPPLLAMPQPISLTFAPEAADKQTPEPGTACLTLTIFMAFLLPFNHYKKNKGIVKK
jgi:hypothetical protein